MRIQKNIALEFNEFSKNYTADMIACVPHYEALLASFIDHLPTDLTPKNILDLGCGNGNVTALLLNYFPSASYTLVDASAEMIEICKEQFNEFDLQYAHSYFEDFEFPKNTFDLIVAGFSLHHCDAEEKQEIFGKSFHALKTGGMIMFSDLMINKSDAEHPRLLKDWETYVRKSFPDGEKWSWLMEHYEAFDKPSNYEDQTRWLADVGFSKISKPFKEDYWVHLQARKS